MKQKKGKKQVQESPDGALAAGSMTRREVVSQLGRAAYIAPAMTVLSLGSIRDVAAESCPPPNPGGGGGCDVPAEAQKMDKSRVKSRRNKSDKG